MGKEMGQGVSLLFIIVFLEENGAEENAMKEIEIDR